MSSDIGPKQSLHVCVIHQLLTMKGKISHAFRIIETSEFESRALFNEPHRFGSKRLAIEAHHRGLVDSATASAEMSDGLFIQTQIETSAPIVKQV